MVAKLKVSAKSLQDREANSKGATTRKKETEVMHSLAHRNHESSNVGLWFAGGAAALAFVFILAKNFASLRRYLRIEMM